MKRKPNTPINKVQWLHFQKHHQKLKEIFNILATLIKNNEEWWNPIWPWTPYHRREHLQETQTIIYLECSRKKKKPHPSDKLLNPFRLSARISSEKHEEKETWKGRRTWERARSVTHWSGTWSLFLSYDSEVVWAGGAPGLQLVMQWEPSSETQGRICGWHRRHREGAPRHQAQPGGQGMSTGNWGRLTEKTAKAWQGAGCPWVPPGDWVTSEPLSPLSLLSVVLGRRRLMTQDSHIQNHSVDLGTSASPLHRWGLNDFHCGGGRLFLM